MKTYQLNQQVTESRSQGSDLQNLKGTGKRQRRGTGIEAEEKAGESVIPMPELQQFSPLRPPPFFPV